MRYRECLCRDDWRRHSRRHGAARPPPALALGRAEAVQAVVWSNRERARAVTWRQWASSQAWRLAKSSTERRRGSGGRPGSRRRASSLRVSRITPSRSAHGPAPARAAERLHDEGGHLGAATTLPARRLSRPVRLRRRGSVVAGEVAGDHVEGLPGQHRGGLAVDPGEAESCAGVGAPGSALATSPRLRKVLEVAQVTSHGASLIRSASGPSRARRGHAARPAPRPGPGRSRRTGGSAGFAPRGRLSASSGRSPSPPATSRLPRRCRAPAAAGREGRPAAGGQIGQARLLDPGSTLMVTPVTSRTRPSTSRPLRPRGWPRWRNR
jgi:hypothetical protein